MLKREELCYHLEHDVAGNHSPSLGVVRDGAVLVAFGFILVFQFRICEGDEGRVAVVFC